MALRREVAGPADAQPIVTPLPPTAPAGPPRPAPAHRPRTAPPQPAPEVAPPSMRPPAVAAEPKPAIAAEPKPAIAAEPKPAIAAVMNSATRKVPRDPVARSYLPSSTYAGAPSHPGSWCEAMGIGGRR